ncbi:hypothetical protein IAT40_004540 [Kwoniella sp. CBS 6097]
MPSRPSSYPSSVVALIQSTSYGPIPSLSSLEDIQATLAEHASYLGSRLPGSSSSSSAAALGGRKDDKKKRKDRDDDDSRERAALEANERAGARLEALERARVEHQRNGPGHGPHGKNRTGTGSPSGVKIKRERMSISPAPSNASSASFRPNHAHGTPITYGGQLKKKKKRVLDSDDEAQSQSRDRSMTLNSPPPQFGHQSHSNHAHPHQSSTSGLKLKLSHTHPHANFKGSRPTTDLSPTPSTSTSNMIDFSLPPPPVRPLIPTRPGVQKPMKPGPKKQSEVDEDYSNAKAPSQIAFPTFWSGVEPYLKDVKEDDLAMLGFKADAPESYEVPPRGRHYTEVWDEEDGNPPGTTPRFPVPALRQEQILQQQPNGAPPLVPHYVPVNELQEASLIEEQRGLGSLTERVVAAFVGRFGFGNGNGSDKKDHPEKDSKEGTSAALESEMEDREPAKVDVAELEERMKKELKGVMLLGEHDEFDPVNREDDEVTASLRQCQRLLSQQTALNDARKTRLAEIAKQRLAYTEYTSALEGIEKSIEAAWAKRIKKYGTTPKKNSSQANGSGRPPVPENMTKLVEIRKHWIEVVGAKMKERPRGDMVGIPARSIYEGLGGEDEEKDEKSVEDQVELLAEEMEVDDAE